MKKTEVSDIITNLNLKAMKYLKLGNPFSAFNLLQKASKLLSSHKSLVDLQMVTLNNLGCYYKWVKKPKEALKQFENSAYLRKIYSVEPVGLAGTYLNISALHSDMGNHNLALKFSQDAVDLLQISESFSPKVKITLAMAYHSLASEFLNLKNFKEASENFEKALLYAKEAPNSSKLVDFIKSSLKKIDKKEESADQASKKLPNISKSGGKERNQLSSNHTKFRFLTGDRMKPMFPRSVSPAMDRSCVDQTLEKIQKKIDFLQNRLDSFHKEIEPLKEIKVEEFNETFSPRSIENFKVFKEMSNAAQVIQRNFRKYSQKREKTA